MKSPEQIKSECYRALGCLYIAVQEDIAADVETKVFAYINYLEARQPQLITEDNRVGGCSSEEMQ